MNTSSNMTPTKMINNEKLPIIATSNIIHAITDEVKRDEKNGEGTSKNEGVSIVWKDLRVITEIKKHTSTRNTNCSYKTIIHDVKGYVEPSNLVAILGASGSGKTTLMSALANRQLGDLKVSGDIRINGKKLQLKLMREISGFVYQDELFVSSLTVLEHLHFVARLKLDKNLTTEHRKKLVNELIRDVGLTKCAKNFIGVTTYGNEKMVLSGGERKRLSVATELLTEPPLLFCDEPTTGLDSFTSLMVITTMRNMTYRRGTTIICSIHQPNEQIFNLFHQIILLHKGRIAYSGTTKDAIEFFRSVGCNYNEDQNPAEYLIECLAVVPGREFETSSRALNICTEFEKSPYAKIIHDRIETERHKTDQDFDFIKKTQRISWLYMLYLFSRRETMVNIRDPALQRMEFIKIMVLGAIIGICMMGTITPTQNGIQSLKGVLFLMVMKILVDAAYCVLRYFPSKMPVFFREYTNNTNTPILFYLSNYISLIPLLILCPLLYVTFIYNLAGLRNSWTIFGWSALFFILLNFTSAAFGILLSISTKNANLASIILFPICMMYINFGGIYINLKSIPWTISWIRYTSWVTYALEVLLALQLEGMNHIECSANLNIPCFKNGQEVLIFLDFDGSNVTKNLIVICIIFFTFFTLSYFALRIKLYYKTKR